MDTLRDNLVDLILKANDAVEAVLEEAGSLEYTYKDLCSIEADYMIANGVTVQKWIPVAERLPDNNNPVLVYCTNTTISGGYITHIGSFNSGRYWFLRAEPGIATFPVREWQVTHWMPLPTPPKEE